MKFTKFGKALLMGALSAGVVLSVTSCVQSYTVGYLYVTGTVTAQTSGAGIISGFKIDHNTGLLTIMHGLPVSSGGANPVRAFLVSKGVPADRITTVGLGDTKPKGTVKKENRRVELVVMTK